MKLLFVSNDFNHHQRFLSDSFRAICNDYKFISTSGMRDNGKKPGYSNKSLPDYVIDFSQSESDVAIEQMLFSCDAVVVGSAPEAFIEAGEKENIGSVPYLPKDCKNGVIYKSRNINMLFEWVKWLLDNRDASKVYGDKAYKTIVTG